MNQLRIALLVADPARDLPGTVLTAYELCQRGATCFVIPLVSARAELFSLAPDYVLMPAVRPYHSYPDISASLSRYSVWVH